MRYLAVMVVSALLAGGAACSSSDQAHSAAFEKQIEPILIEVVPGLAASVIGGPAGPIALLGVYAAGQVADNVLADQDITFLLINQRVDGESRTVAFRIDSTRKLRVSMNGKFVQDIEKNRVVITVDDTVPSRISVADADSDADIFNEGQSSFLVSPNGQYFDLDKIENGELVGGRDLSPGSDVQFASGVGGWGGAENGSTVAHWGDEGQPTLAGCTSLPEPAWSGNLTKDAGLVGNQTWCIRTSEGRYGILAWEAGVPAHLRARVWNATVH